MAITRARQDAQRILSVRECRATPQARWGHRHQTASQPQLTSDNGTGHRTGPARRRPRHPYMSVACAGAPASHSLWSSPQHEGSRDHEADVSCLTEAGGNRTRERVTTVVVGIPITPVSTSAHTHSLVGRTL